MYCPGCGAANVDGAKFCGACGARVTASAAAVSPPASATTPTVVRAPVVTDPAAASLAPARPAGRGRLFALLGVDAVLAITGIVLATRPAAAPAAPPAGAGTASGSAAIAGSGSAPTTSIVTPPRGPGGGGGGRPGSGSDRVVAPGSGTGTGPGTGTGSSPTLAVDARSIDDRLTDAAVVVASAVDAAAVEPIVDAAAALPELDAAEPEPIDGGDDGDVVSAQIIEAQFNRLAVSSGSKFGRCYQSATKALPDDQPLVGEVDISLAVLPTGHPDNVRVDRNTTGSETLASCALGVVRAWTFSPHSGVGPLLFSRSFRFGPQP